MQRVAIRDVDSALGDVDVRHLSDPLGTTDIALNRYRLGPGESLPAGLHAHFDQEEVFAVLAGEAVFETLVPPSSADEAVGFVEYEAREVLVESGEVVRYAPGDFQSGRNHIGGETTILAIGAPKETDDIRLPIGCPACDSAPIRLDTDGGGLTFECPECGEAHVPAPCPECGDDDLQVRLGEDAVTVVECQDCRATFDSPPMQE